MRRLSKVAVCSSTSSTSPRTWAKNSLHLTLLGRAEDAGLQMINEVAIALVGGHAAGRGVGLGEVALALEGHHLGAHRGWRDREVGVVGDRGGADRLGGLDVLDHHGLQDGGLAGVEIATVLW